MLSPHLRQQLADLIALPSVTCTIQAQDMSNLPVISRLAEWFETAGFAHTRQLKLLTCLTIIT